MKRLVIAVVAVAGLGLFVAPGLADAHWKNRNVMQLDPLTGQYVTNTQQTWVPDHRHRHLHLHHIHPHNHIHHRAAHVHHAAHVHAAHVHAAHAAHAAHAGHAAHGGHR